MNPCDEDRPSPPCDECRERVRQRFVAESLVPAWNVVLLLRCFAKVAREVHGGSTGRLLEARYEASAATIEALCT